MSQITYRGNLSARAFPLIAEQFGRTVIVGGQDQNFNRQVVSAEDIDKDRGIPQVYYCHNVMPTAEGLQSVGYIEQTLLDTGVTTFKSVYTLIGTNGVNRLLGHTSDGNNYILGAGVYAWQHINSIPGDTGGLKVTTAVVGSQTFICFYGLGVYYYNTATSTLDKITLIGITDAAVHGITDSSGYLIAWSFTTVAWSSAVAHVNVTDPFDFTPSLITGAGGGNIEAAKGELTVCVKHYLGFIVYTTNNAIGAIYSGNARYPFNFKELIGAGGLEDDALISSGSGAGNHYAYTNSGLQLISMTTVSSPMSEITDFLSGKYFEDFDDTTKAFNHQILTLPLRKAINVIADRYLVVSYGTQEVLKANIFSHVIVFDSAQKRFGKLKIDHVASFEYGSTVFGVSPEDKDTPRTSLGFLQANGKIKTVNFTVGSSISNGTLILGKYQYTRMRLLTLDGVEFENVFPANTFNVTNMLAVDGKNTVNTAMTALTPVGNLRTYACRQTGINHSLLIQGNFYLSSVVLNFHMNGRR